ncbi:multiple epidermal growth factor-like domains protein 10, partial [Saccostrea cucullata]|uniref:multiple epidermal growth factor-like domains protein 10 n=1 Tax=Saccostrea cuccullata TaxID=36930 RepID=UPI002ECFDCAD
QVITYCFRIDNCCREWDEFFTGCKVCSPGYLGRNCTQACPYPNYGLECQGNCGCDKRLCDIATGCFSDSDGCRAGYYGERCMFKCRVPTYGKHCQQICKCDEFICHYITGCPVKESK